MSCISFKEIHDGRAASDDVGDKETTVSYVRVFRAETSLATDDATAIKAHASCPSLGAAHPNNTYARLRNRQFRNETFSKKVWIVTLTYSTKGTDVSGGSQTNPLDTTTRITWRSEQFQKVAIKDKDGNAILNSAQDEYDPPPEKDDSRWIATITKNMVAVPSWLLNYQDAVNSSGFMIDGLSVPARRAKVQSIEIGGWQFQDPYSYRQVTIGIAISRDEYTLKPRDQGFNKLVGGKRVKIMIPELDDNGKKTARTMEPSVPVALNGSGAVVESPTLANAHFNTHYVYNEANFSVLPLV